MNTPIDSSDSPVNSGETLSPQEKKSLQPFLQDLTEKLNSFPTPEEKIAHGLQFMRSSISQEGGSPRFREFWEARKLLLPLFKENLNPAIRSRLWDEYVELTVEARKLKEILEEQSSFAMEQIDLAIGSIEKDLSELRERLDAKALPEEAPRSRVIERREEFYAKIQGELSLLNALASRLNSLRKEVLKTDMRIRFKTKLFKRLSSLGDQVFPRRKELIESLSASFEQDVTDFIAQHFQGQEVVGAPLYGVREEIKALQAVAKSFTLNSGSFHRTREALSKCWDVVKELEKEHKKEVLEKRQAAMEKRAVEEKELEAAREKARILAEEQKEILRLKREKITLLKEKMSALQNEASSLDVESFGADLKLVQDEIETLSLTKMEKDQMKREFRRLKDLFEEKKEQSLLNLSEDDRKVLENLRLVLQQKKERRQEIKEMLEGFRKQLGASNLDFERAIYLREVIDQEKERLEKANLGIQEIEGKIDALEHGTGGL